MTAVQDILRSFGITRCYKGFKHTEYAICLATRMNLALRRSQKKSTWKLPSTLNAIGRQSNEISELLFPAHGLSIPICSARWQVIHWNLNQIPRNLSR